MEFKISLFVQMPGPPPPFGSNSRPLEHFLTLHNDRAYIVLKQYDHFLVYFLLEIQHCISVPQSIPLNSSFTLSTRCYILLQLIYDRTNSRESPGLIYYSFMQIMKRPDLLFAHSNLAWHFLESHKNNLFGLTLNQTFLAFCWFKPHLQEVL